MMCPLAVTTMMYGFGDDQTPYKESVELVEVTAAIASVFTRSYTVLITVLRS